MIAIFKNKLLNYLAISCLSLFFTACVPSLVRRDKTQKVPESYNNSQDTTNVANIQWREYYSDPNLISLIDTALANNQELNIILQDINISNFEIRSRKGQYLPFLNIEAGAGVENVGRYTRPGAVDATTDIKPGTRIPENLPDFLIAANLSWQVDIWKQLRNAKKSAVYRYLASKEGRNFMVTRLVAEIAASYYELMALDNQLDILQANIQIQQNALKMVRMEKQAARVTELAVRRFEAEVFKNRSRIYFIQQQIIETENRINFLVGRFPQPVQRSSSEFSNIKPNAISAGVPPQLLQHRPDIRQAELQLSAAKLDVKVAKANFYPNLRITAGAGYQAFNPKFLISTPQSMLYNLAGDLITPVINRNAIKAEYMAANARQIQTVFNYERTVLRAYVEVVNQVANVSNMGQSYDLKSQQVQALNESIQISMGLFRAARATYMEVLLTQRDALEAKMDLVETKKDQLIATVNIYQALGGGW